MSYLYQQIHDSLETQFWAAATAKAAVPAIALAGALYTALQFRRAKRWRASDLAAKLFADLTTDDELAFACQAIDWSEGPLIIPVRYRPIMMTVPSNPNSPTRIELGEIAQHDTEIMAAALQVRLHNVYQRYPLYLVYRYCFDRLFMHLSNVNRLLETKQLLLKDLGNFKYWLERLAKYEYPPSDVAGEVMFQRFLSYEGFGYGGIRNLGMKLGVGGWAQCDVADILEFENRLLTRPAKGPLQQDPAARVNPD
jgi:hypothetical protein